MRERAQAIALLALVAAGPLLGLVLLATGAVHR